MPEIKHNFTGGKMNKDVDQRLVPKGEYRDAMNIQVSTSEGSDVGTVQNILGNKLVDGLSFLSPNSTCVGAIADEKNDAFYWLIASQIPLALQQSGPLNTTGETPYKASVSVGNYILEHKNNTVSVVFADLFYKSVFQTGPINQTQLAPNLTIPASNHSFSAGDIINEISFTSTFETNLSLEVVATTGSSFTVDTSNLSTSLINTILTSSVARFVASPPGVLGFNPNNMITGINIIDDMLFWTDGETEPKKINIPRCKEGTDNNGQSHTRLINPAQSISYSSGVLVQEEHVTVIRKAPKNVLTTTTEVDPISAFGTTIPVQTFLINPSNPAQGNLTSQAPNNVFSIIILLDPLSPNPLSVDDILLFNPSSSSSTPSDEHQVSAVLTNQTSSGQIDISYAPGMMVPAGTYEVWDAEVVDIDSTVATYGVEYNWAVQTEEDQKFKNKFPRFSYRYKYEDGEYSSFAPFTNVIFEPENFKYDVKEAFNLGMENAITKITLSNYNSNIPSDVVSIDLLYKESNSPVIYTVDTIDSVNSLTSSTHSYEVKINQIKSVVPENQLLRAWDSVPRTSLAQEITGNRIVYGNYLQNYNLQETPKLLATLVDREDCDTNHKYKSLKSIRNYSLGISYLDEYGRQTPVFTNKQADIEIPIKKSDNVNQVSSKILGNTPDWAKYYKVFVKETSSEYYNLAMDRIYDARDSNVWLSFPSSDRNKVDEETFLILKKGVEGAQPVDEKNRYKILAIENEAPDFIKTELKVLGTAREDGSGTFPGTYFTNNSGYPIASKKKIIIKKTAWDTIGLGLESFDKIEVKFSILIGGTLIQETKAYEVVNFEGINTGGIDEYTFILAKAIEEEWLANPALLSEPEPTIGITIFSKELENRPEFDGRFFVKVSRDININTYIVSQAMESMIIEQQVGSQIPFYYLSDSNGWSGTDTSSAISGISGGSTSTADEWEAFYAQTGAEKSTWFIDEAYYAGYFPPSDHAQLNTSGLSPSGAGSTGTIYNNGATSDYNKGIWTDTNGQSWIYLSFGYIKTFDNTPWVNSDIVMQNSSPNSTQIWLANCIAPWNSTNGCNLDQTEVEALYGGMWDTNDNNDRIAMWKVGDAAVNPAHGSESDKVMNLTQGQKFRFLGDPDNTIYTINAAPELYYHLSYHNTQDMEDGENDSYDIWFTGSSGSMQGPATTNWIQEIAKHSHSRNRRATWRIPIDKNPTDADSSFNPIASGQADASNIGTIQFIEDVWTTLDDQIVPEDPAIWETEPKQDIDLDIYYEVDGTFPLEINNDTNYTFAPIGSTVNIIQPSSAIPMLQPGTTVVGWNGNVVELSLEANNCDISQYMTVVFNRPDGSCVEAELLGLSNPVDGPCDTSFFLNINPNVSNQTVKHSWFNCYSFGNGVESDRVRDDYNQVRIDKGAKASSTLDEPYKEEYRKYGLIYSGIYNSTSGVNSLNQFIAAEKITKDINPIYGSIQKLHSGWGQGGDLIALCEDRILKILANKDALYNADGNTNVTSTNNVLGQAIPYSGEYGISENPESFASEAYRVYFTDKVRGTVMRLSMDGLTPISNHGMKDWFRDNLKLSNKLVGSYDDKKDEYNITIKGDTIAKTVTFKEDVKGWVSFKSFTPENAISCANEYYTFLDGRAWKHHDETKPRNTFYDHALAPSTLEVVFNEVPGSVKSFKTINYEGSQAKVTKETGDNEYFNLSDVDGWYVENIVTNLEQGGITEFVNKEGKWFGYVTGNDVTHNLNGDVSGNYYTEDFSIQGVGRTISAVNSTVFGCTNENSYNYNPAANQDDGSCVAVVYGCLDPNADNYYPGANVDDDSCVYLGCTTGPLADWNNQNAGGSINYDPNATQDDGSCITAVFGCTDSTMFNYNNLANVGTAILSDGTNCGYENCACTPFIYGCTDSNADNYITLVDAMQDVNTDDGSCIYNGCTDPLATNYDFANSTVGTDINGSISYVWLNGTAVDDGSCTYPGGCTDSTACNYDSTPGMVDNGSCQYCGDNDAVNYDGAQDTSCTTNCTYCEQPVPLTISAQATSDANMNNGSVTLEWAKSTSATIQYYEITINNGSPINVNPSGNATETHTINNLAPGTYDFQVIARCTQTSVLGTVSATPIFIQTHITVTPILGCTDYGQTYYGGVTNPAGGTWGACNFNPAATQDDGSCEYTTCTGCNDPLYVEYCGDCWDTINQVVVASNGTNWVADTIPTSCLTLIVYGCTDATAFNYDPLATVDDGSCVPVVLGCMDSTLNNNGTYAASNYAGPGSGITPEANTDDGSCLPYNCPVVAIASAGGGIQVNYALAATVYSPNIASGGYPNDFTLGLTVTSSTGTTLFSEANYGGMSAGSNYVHYDNISPSAVSAIALGQTAITVLFTVDSNDGLCSVSKTATYTVGCNDPLASIPNSNFDITDNSQCTYAGCTDSTPSVMNSNANAATNYDPNATVSCGTNNDNECCTYHDDQDVVASVAGGTNFWMAQLAYEPVSTGYTEAVFSSLTLGEAPGTVHTLTNVFPKINMTSSLNDRIAAQLIPAIWETYVYNNNLRITLNADFNGACDNDFLSDQLPTGSVNKTFNFSVGCKDDNTAINYDPNVDLGMASTCIAANPGCMDSTATNYSTTFNQDCTFNGSANPNDCCCYTCGVPTFNATNLVVVNTWNDPSSPVYATQITFNFAVVSTAASYVIFVDGGSTALIPVVSPTINNGIVSYTFNTTSTTFQNESTYNFKVRAICKNNDGDFCDQSDSADINILLQN